MTTHPPIAGSRRRQRERLRPQNKLAATACEVLLVATVLGSVLAIGTVHPQVLLAISALAILGGGLAMLEFRRPPTPAIVLAALGLFSLVQAISLPASVAHRLSPGTAQIWLHCLDPFHEPAPARFPVSLDAGASVAEGLKWFSYAAVYVLTARVRMQRSSAWLAALLFISAAIVSLLTLWHGAINEHSLYGFYKPHFAVGRWNVGPLLNSNNFAGYANLGLFAGLGLLLSRSTNLPRLPVGVGLGMIACALLLSNSRAGILSAVAGSIVVVIWLARRRAVGPALSLIAKVTAPVLLALVLVFLSSTSKERAAFSLSDIERKVSVWRWSLTMIADHPWLGVGRGAYETAFPRYRLGLSTDWTALSAYAENFVIQWLAEWGVLVGSLAVFALVGYVAKEWFESRGERLRFLLLSGVLVLLLQNFADLGLEIPSLMIAVVVAVAAGEKPLRKAKPTERSSRLIGAVGAVTVMTIVWLTAAAWSRWPADEERLRATHIYRALHDRSEAERLAFRIDLRSAMQRHPGDPHFPLLGALLAARARDESPLPWLSRALELGPTDGRVHLVLAELLGRHRAVVQAMLHLRLAMEYDGTLVGDAAVRVARWAPTLEVLKQAIPTGTKRTSALTAVCEAVTRTELRISCFDYAISQDPLSPRLQSSLAESFLLALRKQVAPCAGEQAQACFSAVNAAARRLSKLEPQDWHASYLSAKNLAAQGDFNGAAMILGKICPPAEDGQECARESLNAAIAGGSDPVILSAADAYAARGCSGTSTCAASLDWLGATLDAAGKGAFAVTYFSKAAEMESTVERWLHVADRAAKLQLPGIARTALNRADRSPDATVLTRATTMRLRTEVDRSSRIDL
jgi:hypothetical protein